MERNLYSYEQLKKNCEELSKQYKGFIKKVSIGKSWDNREIPMLILGSGRKIVLLSGGVHGRESINPAVLVRMADRYACLTRNHLSARNICFESWFQEHSLLIVPLVNPDGYEIALKGFAAIKNSRLRLKCKEKAVAMKIPASEWKYNGRAVDINRNFPCKSWIQESIGDIPASERETKALMQVFQKYRPELYLDYHSRERSIYYYRQAKEAAYNERQRLLAEELSHFTGYRLKEPGLEIESGDRGGNTVHYASEYGNCPAFTIETVWEEEAFPLRAELQEEVLREIWLTPFIRINH
ncbi:M14 family zinc carboxypeptidase [Acetivibrio ethanolgignens]|uniref:Peptidase M14 domain-containing protein n=1 Tax=Acetivibrio ethanolgignens TaxID=290052 RepID=A0A0V8QFT6_9FIRM|nr:M14 family zinc carboxypeptidase [Acetivibrio ethanolgignens]KSV59267.1 hypothetical protein ASU35_09715 [Acetivibrio ethanolgignens]